jgi:hypothetical protein
MIGYPLRIVMLTQFFLHQCLFENFYASHGELIFLFSSLACSTIGSPNIQL